MRKLAANQLTQEMYGQRLTFYTPVKRGHVSHTITLGMLATSTDHVRVWAQGSDEDYRLHPYSIVEVA